MLSSHSDYWNDDVVIGTIVRTLRSAPPVARAAGSDLPASYVTPFATTDTAERGVGRAALVVGIAVVILVVSLSAVQFARVRAAWLAGIETDVERLQQNGTTTPADVTYWRVEKGEDTPPEFHFTLRLPERALVLPEITIYGDGTGQAHAYRFDHVALAQYIGAKCTPAEKKRWWQIFRIADSIPCTRTSIPIVYDPDLPEVFMVPMFPVRDTTGPLEAFATDLITVAAFAAVCATVLLGGGLPLFRLFLGLAARPFWAERRGG